MNYSLSNSAISRSHQALGDFDVDILQYSFGRTGGKQSTLGFPAAVPGLLWALPERRACSWCQTSRCAATWASLCKNRLFFPPPRALPGMMQWIRSQRPGENGINIITADFVELGEFISAVISLNYHLDDDEDDATWGVVGWGELQGSTVTSRRRPVLQVCALILLSLAFISGGRLQCFFHFI